MFTLAKLTNFIGFVIIRFIFRKKVNLGDYRRTEWRFMITGCITLVLFGYFLGMFLKYTI